MVELIIGVVLGALLSWGIAHWYYSKASSDQKEELDSLSERLKHRNTLVDFTQHLLNSEWDQEQIRNKDVWICRENTTFQISLGKARGGYDEPWVFGFENKSASTCPVYLKIGEVVIKELLFAYADEFRVFVPMPEIRASSDGKGGYEFYWRRSGLEFEVCRVIGQYHIFGDLDGVAAMARATVED